MLNYIIKFYGIYALIFGVLVLGFYRHSNSNYMDKHPVERFFGGSVSQDRVALVEDRYESGLARIQLIQNANDSIDMAYYKIEKGVSSNVFSGCILDAANRGVKIRLLLDGSIHNQIVMKEIEYAFINHPNIELKFYEPVSLFKPWGWNNRLHDKIIVVDNVYAMLGGRNIGDRFFVPDNYDGEKTNDRDVVIVNTDKTNVEKSAISQVNKYFKSVWEHKFTKSPKTDLTLRQQKKGEKESIHLKEYLANTKEIHPHMFNQNINWHKKSVPTKKVTIIHNPIQRYNKEPWCFYDITNLMRVAKDSIFVQSPYIVPTKSMLEGLEGINISPTNIDILTNSLAVTPNIMAYSGHIRHRRNIIDSGANVYEFQGEGSTHAKSYILDNRISLVGSFNFDSRSTYLSTETMVVIDSEQFANTLGNEIQKHLGNSLKVAKDYSYMENSNVNEEKVFILKPIIVRLLSVVTYLVEFLL